MMINNNNNNRNTFASFRFEYWIYHVVLSILDKISDFGRKICTGTKQNQKLQNQI